MKTNQLINGVDWLCDTVSGSQPKVENMGGRSWLTAASWCEGYRSLVKPRRVIRS